MTTPALGDWTPSDSGPWRTLWDDDLQMTHVMPAFGPRHQLSWKCWCHPVFDGDYTVAALSHNVAQ